MLINRIPAFGNCGTTVAEVRRRGGATSTSCGVVGGLILALPEKRDRKPAVYAICGEIQQSGGFRKAKSTGRGQYVSCWVLFSAAA